MRVRRKAKVADGHHIALLTERICLRVGCAVVVCRVDAHLVAEADTIGKRHAVSTDPVAHVVGPDFDTGVFLGHDHTDADRFRLRIELERILLRVVRGADHRRGLGVARFPSIVFGGLRRGGGCHHDDRDDCECSEERRLGCGFAACVCFHVKSRLLPAQKLQFNIIILAPTTTRKNNKTKLQNSIF